MKWYTETLIFDESTGECIPKYKLLNNEYYEHKRETKTEITGNTGIERILIYARKNQQKKIEWGTTGRP